MDDLRQRLHAAAARPEGPFDEEDVRRRVRQRHRTRVASAAAGVIAVVLAGAVGFVSFLEEISEPDDVEVELAPAPPAEDEDEPPDADRPDVDEPRQPDEDLSGTWSELPPGPIEGRLGAEAVWTGDEVIVWGGAPGGAGAAYDPAAEQWRELPEAPLAPRQAHVAVWSGEELVVWGGTEAELPASTDEAGEPSAEIWDDGAAYDPSSDQWRPLPEAPIDGRTMAAAAWTGEELVIAGGAAAGADPGTFDDRRDGAAYDPAEDSWRTIPDLPEDSNGATDGVWTGEEFVVPVGTHLNPMAAAAYDPTADEWRTLADAPAVPGVGSDLAWTGEEVAVVFGALDGEPGGQAAAYDPGQDSWRDLPDPPTAMGSQPQVVWAGQQLLVISGADDPEEALRVGHLDAGADEWSVHEGPLAARSGPLVAWTDEELFVWGGVSGVDTEAELRDDGAVWRPPPGP